MNNFAVFVDRKFPLSENSTDEGHNQELSIIFIQNIVHRSIIDEIKYDSEIYLWKQGYRRAVM